jgi:hypothetical protein
MPLPITNAATRSSSLAARPRSARTRADLEQTKVALHPREIVLGSARQRLEDVAPQVRLVFGEGIEHTT